MSFERPAFCSSLTASGNGEVWDHHSDSNKFNQFGWRCTTNETGYKHNTLIGNWNEESFDTKNIAKNKPIPSNTSHYFDTTYNKDYLTGIKREELPTHVKRIGGVPTEPRTFPRHQPELDKVEFKHHYNSFESSAMASYKNPKLMSSE